MLAGVILACLINTDEEDCDHAKLKYKKIDQDPVTDLTPTWLFVNALMSPDCTLSSRSAS